MRVSLEDDNEYVNPAIRSFEALRARPNVNPKKPTPINCAPGPGGGGNPLPAQNASAGNVQYDRHIRAPTNGTTTTSGADITARHQHPRHRRANHTRELTRPESGRPRRTRNGAGADGLAVRSDATQHAALTAEVRGPGAAQLEEKHGGGPDRPGDRDGGGSGGDALAVQDELVAVPL